MQIVLFIELVFPNYEDTVVRSVLRYDFETVAEAKKCLEEFKKNKKMIQAVIRQEKHNRYTFFRGWYEKFVIGFRIEKRMTEQNGEFCSRLIERGWLFDCIKEECALLAGHTTITPWG